MARLLEEATRVKAERHELLPNLPPHAAGFLERGRCFVFWEDGRKSPSKRSRKYLGVNSFWSYRLVDSSFFFLQAFRRNTERWTAGVSATRPLRMSSLSFMSRCPTALPALGSEPWRLSGEGHRRGVSQRFEAFKETGFRVGIGKKTFPKRYLFSLGFE